MNTMHRQDAEQPIRGRRTRRVLLMAGLGLVGALPATFVTCNQTPVGPQFVFRSTSDHPFRNAVDFLFDEDEWEDLFDD